MKSGDFNARYQSALKAMSKQQMLLGQVLDTKYTKQFGTSWKKDFRVLKQKWTNLQNLSVPGSMIEDADGSESATDSDATDEEGYSGSETEEEMEPKSFLVSILTAARPWSTNGRLKKIRQETSVERVYKMVQNSKDPRDCVFR